MSSFDDFYKKWKEKNEITTETPYQNLTDEQKAQSATQGIDAWYERYNNTNTQNNSTWNQVQNIASNKNKNESLIDDAKGLLKLIGLGTSTGTKQTLNYIESANENNFNNYKNLKNRQFLTSKNVSEEDKTVAKNQNNLLLQKNGINAEQKIETNLVKKAIQESIIKDEEKIQEEQSKMSNVATQKLGEIAPSLGQMIPGTVATAINPALGTAYYTTSAGGSYIDDARQRGMTDEKAFKYGTIMAMLEGGSESIITGQQLSKVTKAFAGKEISKNILDSYGFNIFENAIQEAVMEPAQEITAGIIGDKADWTDIVPRMLGSAFNGGLMGGITNGVTYGLEKSGNIYNKMKNGDTISETEYKEALQENIEYFGKDKVEEAIRQGATEKYQEINNIANPQQNTTINQNKSQTQQTIQEINRMAQNGNMEQANNNLANNQESLYNNSKERESDLDVINRGTQETDLERDFGESRVLEERKQTTEQNYREWEQSIKPKQDSEFTYEEQIKIDSENFSRQVDDYIAGKIKSSDFINVGKTPQILQNIGLPNNDIILKQSKLKTMMQESNNSDSKLHGLPADTVKRIPEALANPLNVLQSSTDKNSVVVITDLADKMDRPIIASIEVDYKGRIGNIDFLSNRLTSAYGKNNYDRFMQTEIDKGNLLYDIDEGIIKELPTSTRLQSSEGLNSFDETSSFINNSIPQNKNSVKDNTITNNYAQNNENNTQNEVNLPTKENPTRHEVIQKNRQLARENIENISTWKDKKSGIRYQLETMERNMYDIIPDKTEAKKINDTYFEPIHTSEAEKQKFINNYNDRIRQFELNKYESEAVQFLGEKKYNPDFNKGSQEDISARNEIESKINKNIKNGKINQEKVNNAIEEFRKIYDELFELENNTLRENGYKEKPYRKGYFPHFVDYVPETKTEKVLNKLGFKIDKRPLPTDIAGITEQFVPGKTWNRSALERKGNKTDYNALKGFDTYIAQASDNIFHTENIQKLRGLENEIRYQYSDKGVQERIDNILNDETLFEEEKQNLIDEIFKQVENPMPNLVTELRRYTNALANKKSEADRSIEQSAGRSIYSTVNAIENRFGANAVGLNIGSAVTNFIPITQAYSQVSTKNMGRAFIDTVKSYVVDDGFVNKSTFLTNRLNQSEKLYKTTLDKISDKANFLFNAIDDVTSNIVVRGKYIENINNGMSEIEAIKDADRFGANVMADRSKGALPTKFEEKNPLTKMLTQFQLEVNNQYRYMFKDIPRDLAEKGLGSIALAFLKMFVGAWLYNEASEKITGRKPAFSPIDLAVSSYKTITDKDMKTYDKVASIGTDIAEQLPFAGGLVGGGRVPVNGAIPDVGNLTKAGVGLATGEMDSRKAVNTIGKEISKPLYYLLPPFGGGQIKKSVEGIQTVAKGGSYGVDSKGEETLQFPVENANVGDYIKAGIFGKYALPLAKDYTDSGYKSLNAKDTKGYKDTKIPYKEFITYTNSNLKKKEEKIDFINNMNINEQQKWAMYCYDIFESTERKKDKGSQLEDAKFAVKNGISKSEYIKLYNSTRSRNMDMPTQEENKKLIDNGIKLKNYMDYAIKVHDETKKQKTSGDIKENGQLKNKDKIQILLDSKYSENEKMAIYKNYINNEDKKTQLVEKLNFPITEYLKYKTQEFTNDKDENEETIKGSKKEKVYNYLNNIYDNDLSQDYKKIICKIEGTNTYDKDIVNFVTNYPGLTGEEQKELLEIIGFDVDKNGYIKTTTMLPIKKNIK